MANTRQPTMLWALFGFNGRINREVYWLGNFGAAFIAFVLMMPSLDEATGTILMAPWSPFIALPIAWVEVALAVKRLHDRGFSGMFAAAMFIPFLNILAALVIGIIPGDRGANRFGPDTNTRPPQ